MMRAFFIKQTLFTAVVLSSVLFVSPSVGFAAPATDNLFGGGGDAAFGAGDGAVSKGGDAPYRLDNPASVDSVYELLDLALQVVLIIVVPFAILFIVYAGLKFIAARGNPEKLKDARSNLWHVFIGITIVVLCSVGLQALINLTCDIGTPGLEVCD